jgi:hypothetical protein
MLFMRAATSMTSNARGYVSLLVLESPFDSAMCAIPLSWQAFYTVAMRCCT